MAGQLVKFRLAEDNSDATLIDEILRNWQGRMSNTRWASKLNTSQARVS